MVNYNHNGVTINKENWFTWSEMNINYLLLVGSQMVVLLKQLRISLIDGIISHVLIKHFQLINSDIEDNLTMDTNNYN